MNHAIQTTESDVADLYIRIRDVPSVVAKWTGNQTKPSRSVVYRWLKDGNRGRKLRRCYIGGIAHTRESWLREFVESTAGDSNQQDATDRPPSRPRSRRPSSSPMIQSQLSAMGLG